MRRERERERERERMSEGVRNQREQVREKDVLKSLLRIY